MIFVVEHTVIIVVELTVIFVEEQYTGNVFSGTAYCNVCGGEYCDVLWSSIL